MPPEVFHSHNICTPQLPGTISSRSELNFSEHRKHRQLKQMQLTFTRKKVIHVLVFILACLSTFRLFRIAINSYSTSRNVWLNPLKPGNFSDSSNLVTLLHTKESSLSSTPRPITKKEYRFLRNIISPKAPYNLLIFGWEPEYHRLAKLNAGGTTVFLLDSPESMKIMRRSNNTKYYTVRYDTSAKEAYSLLKHARESSSCAPNLEALNNSTCKLALRDLPQMVYRQKWDIIIVDGPGSDGPEAPGRMSAIYTSSIIGRATNTTVNVVVHDVDRMIEKWFSWEFLCEENLASSKGRYWNFRIRGGNQFNPNSFCSQHHSQY